MAAVRRRRLLLPGGGGASGGLLLADLQSLAQPQAYAVFAGTDPRSGAQLLHLFLQLLFRSFVIGCPPVLTAVQPLGFDFEQESVGTSCHACGCAV